MATKVMRVPNPYRNMAVDRVIVIGQSDDEKFVQVLSIDALGKNPKLMQPFGSKYTWATAIWNYVSLLVLFAGIILSFLWHWWLCIPGLFLGAIIFKSTRQGTADFAAKILTENDSAYDYFAGHGLIWDAPADRVQSED